MKNDIVGTPQPSARGTIIIDDILTNADEHVARWVSEQFGEAAVSVPYKSVGVLDAAGNVVGGAYFYSYREGRDIYVAVAMADGVNMPRDAVVKILAYPFLQLDLRRISADIEEDNRRALEQAEILGFQLEGIKRGAGSRGQDVFMMGLFRDQCPFWRRKG